MGPGLDVALLSTIDAVCSDVVTLGGDCLVIELAGCAVNCVANCVDESPFREDARIFSSNKGMSGCSLQQTDTIKSTTSDFDIADRYVLF